MGILAGVAAMSLRGLRTPALSSAANEVASAVKMTRQMAIASGRTMYLVFPVRSNALTTNSYRTYAIFEEVKPGQETRNPDSTGAYVTNPIGGTSWFIPRTDWRVLADGVVISSLAHTYYSSTIHDGFAGLVLGEPRTRGIADDAPEWDHFSLLLSTMNVRRPSDPGTPFVSLLNIPYIRFSSSGLAFAGSADSAGLTLLSGFTQGDQIAVTGTNNFFVVEVDALVGRIRLRTPESYRP